jgi:hypothetical protein
MLVKLLAIVGLFFMQYDYYIPAIWQEYGPPLRDDTIIIQDAINELGVSGGKVVLPSGVYEIKETIVIGNMTSDSVSSVSGVTLEGAGTGSTGYYHVANPPAGATVLKWIGEPGGTILRINGAEGCSIRDIAFDGNGLASTLIEADFAFHLFVENVIGYQWAGMDADNQGYAIRILNSRDKRGGHGQVDQLWEHVIMANPIGNYASGLDIAPDGSYNVNELTFLQSTFMRSNVPDEIAKVASLRLGYTDHIRFIGCLLAANNPSHSYGEIKSKIAIEIKPIQDFDNNMNLYQFPMNITFLATPFYGGIYHNNTIRDRTANKPALIFYPYYSADGQPVPPLDYSEKRYLPTDMVGGITDDGRILDGR